MWPALTRASPHGPAAMVLEPAIDAVIGVATEALQKSRRLRSCFIATPLSSFFHWLPVIAGHGMTEAPGRKQRQAGSLSHIRSTNPPPRERFKECRPVCVHRIVARTGGGQPPPTSVSFSTSWRRYPAVGSHPTTAA